MRIPYGLTESQVIKVINKVANILAPSFAFGYHTIEDVKQEAFVAAMSGLEKYDWSKNADKVKCCEERLARFLSVHIRNRLLNFKRKHYFRYEKPKFEAQVEDWEKNNQSRRNLMHFWDLSDVPDKDLGDGTDFEEDYDNKEWFEHIESSMDGAIRNDFRRMLAGVFLTDLRKEAVQAAVTKILDAQKEN